MGEAALDSEAEALLNTATSKPKDPEELLQQIVKNQEQMQQQINSLAKRFDKVEEELEATDVEVKKTNDTRTRLEKSDNAIQKEFWRKIRELSKDGEGISWKQIMQLYNVKKSRAYEIFAEIESDEDNLIRLERHPRDVLIHAKWYIIYLLDKWYPEARKKAERKNESLESMYTEQLVEILQDNVSTAEKDARVEKLEVIQRQI